jgi:HTH-type transcriptional regulator/antitoxin HigA
MTTRRPAEVFPPGDFIQEILEARGWTQADLAEILGRPVSLVNDLLAGRRGITPQTAQDLAAAFDTSPEYWMNLDSSYQLSRVRADERGAIGRRARLYARAPVKEMVRRGWIEPSANVDVLEERVCRFLEIGGIDEDPDVPLHAARKATPYGQRPTPAQLAWLFRAIHLARTVAVAPYAKGRLERAIPDLRGLMAAAPDVRRVPDVLTAAGVRFVVVQPLPGTKIDGACTWVDGSPTVVLSLRFDRVDHFWFVLLHELAHVLQGTPSLDVDLKEGGNGSLPDPERAANAYAEAHLLPPGALDGFIARVEPRFSGAAIAAFARSVGVHPGIVVGRLQHRGAISFAALRATLAPVREWITATATTDGWGSATAIDR